MSWKYWPYWVKGIVIGVGFLICGTIILSILAAGSSLCGLNSGPGESRVCTSSERLDFFFATFYSILILPCILTAYNFVEYRSWKMLTQTDDLFSVFLILIGLVIISAFLGWLYGKIKNRNKPQVNGNIS